MKKLRSRLALFSRNEGQPSASRNLRPTAAEARRRMKLWGSQVDLADELERELSLLRASAENEGELLDCDDAISLTSSDPAASALLGYAQEEQEMFEGEEFETEPSQSSCPAYEELLEVMERATARLDLPWERTKRYQADLLKDLDKGQGLSPDKVAELRRTTDLALRATKQTATAMDRSMAAMVVT